MKRMLCLLLFAAMLCLNLSGCATLFAGSESMPEPTWEKMEVYQVLSENIDEDATLDEMLDAFYLMCQVPMEVTCDIYVYDVHAYEYEGQQYLHFMVCRQFEVRGYYEFLEIGFSVTFALDEDIADLHEDIRMEDGMQRFLQYIRESEAYQTLRAKPIQERNVGIDSW